METNGESRQRSKRLNSLRFDCANDNRMLDKWMKFDLFCLESKLTRFALKFNRRDMLKIDIYYNRTEFKLKLCRNKY